MNRSASGTPGKRKRLRRSLWLPIVLAAWFAIMAFYNAPELLASGQTGRLVTTTLVELAVIAGLFFALRKKEKLAERREQLDKAITKFNQTESKE